MTNVTFYTLENGSLHGYEVTGHAGGKRIRGYDLVCCAVSVLAQTGVNALCKELDVEALAGVQVKDGYLRCVLPDRLDEDVNGRAQVVLRTVQTGLTDIQKIYPNLIRIQQKEWRQADAYDESSALRS